MQVALVGTLAGRHHTAPCPRASTGPQGSKLCLPGAVPAAGSLPAQGPSDSHQTVDLCQNSYCVYFLVQRATGWGQEKEGKDPAHMVPGPSETGSCTPTSVD